MKRAVIIHSYNRNLPVYFGREKDFLVKNLGKDFEIHHVGSSAVPGLGGKNVIDIQLLVPDKKIAVNLITKLESIGYFHNEKGGDKYRIFFNRNRFYGNKKVHIHLHLMWKSSQKFKDYLMFRDYLRKHPEEAKMYYSLKKLWAKKAGNTPEKYTLMKTEYVKEVLKKARLENN
jgi:GrpB-like predicted nucleotidyltransferase (UPF0157 family)